MTTAWYKQTNKQGIRGNDLLYLYSYLHVYIKCLAHRKLDIMFMTIIIFKLFPAIATFAEENSIRCGINRFDIIFCSSIMTTAWYYAALILPSIGIIVNMSKRFQWWKSSLKEYKKVYNMLSNIILWEFVLYQGLVKVLTLCSLPLFVWITSTSLPSSLDIVLDKSVISNHGLAGSKAEIIKRTISQKIYW